MALAIMFSLLISLVNNFIFFFFSSRRRHTRLQGDWSSDVCSSDLTASVRWTADNVWNQPIPDAPGNARMMKGYLDNGNQNTARVTVSGLPSNVGGFNVYVYAQGSSSSNASNTGVYQISGTGITTTSATLTYTTNFNGTFTQATAGSPNGNYVVLTIPNVPGFTLSAIPSTASNGYKRAPVNGIQIVPLGTPNPDFTISATPASQTVNAGNSTSYTVSVSPLNGFTGTVNLAASGLPSGATPSFSPTSISGSGTSTLTVSTATGSSASSSTLTITGTSGLLSHSATVTLIVSASGSSTGVISVDFVGLNTTPMGSSESAGVVVVSNWNDAAGASSGSSPLALVDQNGIPTTATVTWTADNVWNQPIPDAPGNARMMKGYLDNGNQNTARVTVSGLPSNVGGFNVYVYAQGSSSSNASNTGVYQISGTGITTTSATLTYTTNFNGTFTQATAGSPNGNYVVLTIPNVPGFTLSAIPSTASNGYKRAPVNGIQIVPLGTPNPDFTISATPASQTVNAGNSTSYTVSVSPLNGFTGTVNLAASGLPSGATPSFSPTSISGSGTSTLTVSTATGSSASSSTLTITGTSGLLSHSATVTLIVSASGSSTGVISVDFVGLNTTPMGSSESAGVVVVSNWNDAAGASSGSSPLALVDQNGIPTTATVTWTADNVWNQPIPDAPGNARMMKGYLDNGNQNTARVTVSGLPSNVGGFNVYVYAQGSSSSNASNTGVYQISGTGITTTSATLTYTTNFNGTFTQATAGSPNGNYVVLTIPNVPGFTLSAIPSTASNGYKRAPVNGIQIVPLGTPNPDFTISA